MTILYGFFVFGRQGLTWYEQGKSKPVYPVPAVQKPLEQRQVCHLCTIHYQQKKRELSTNLHVDPKAWDVAGQFAKGKTEEVQATNRRLALIKADLHKKYLQLETLCKPITCRDFKKRQL